MKPEVNKVMTALSGTILTKIMPNLNSEYAQRDAGLLSLIMTAASEEYDRAAEVRVAENRDMRTVFAAAAHEVQDRELSDRLEAAAKTTDANLRISALNKSNNELRQLLIDLQVYVEGQDADWASAIDRQIWDALRASTKRRAIAFFPL